MSVLREWFHGTWRPAALYPLGMQNSKLEEITGFREQCQHKGDSHDLTRASGLSPLLSPRQRSDTLQDCWVLCKMDTPCTPHSDGHFGQICCAASLYLSFPTVK